MAYKVTSLHRGNSIQDTKVLVLCMIMANSFYDSVSSHLAVCVFSFSIYCTLIRAAHDTPVVAPSTFRLTYLRIIYSVRRERNMLDGHGGHGFVAWAGTR